MPPAERHFTLSSFTLESSKQFKIMPVTIQLESIEITRFSELARRGMIKARQAKAEEEGVAEKGVKTDLTSMVKD